MRTLNLPVVLIMIAWCAVPIFAQQPLDAATDATALAQNSTADSTSPPPDVVPVEKEPAIVKTANPKYPEKALREGLEGTVWVNIWIDTEGIPRKVTVTKTSNDVFDEAAVEAAKQFVFTPAYAKGAPVAVWVTVPFKFKLDGDKEDEVIKKNIRDVAPTLKKPTVLLIAGPKGLEEAVKYPQEAIKQRIEGTVLASATLNDQMRVTELKITKGIGGGCDEEVMKAVLAHKFGGSSEAAQYKNPGPIRVVVQFLLPAKEMK